VLDALLRQRVDVPYSCRQQVCMSCIMRCLNGSPPPSSQANLKQTLQMQSNFLACGCYPEGDMEIAPPRESVVHQVSAEVVELNRLNSLVLELVLQCNAPLNYHAGQAVLLMNADLLGKRLPIASPTSAKGSGRYEVHVERIPGGFFSEWVHEQLRIGDKMTLCGVDGELFYIPGHPRKPVFLAGWNSGLGALMGILHDALENNHTGPLCLFHGVTRSENLYFAAKIKELGRYYPNFRYIPCVEQDSAPDGCFKGPVTAAAKARLPELSDWTVYLCGPREQVHQMQRQAYLAGASTKDIYREITEI
jgi:NAD(P)H-flavin reductase